MSNIFECRAWHKLAIQIVVIDMLDFRLDAYRAHSLDGRFSGSGHLADIELLEYTGLVDKNGRKIYVGDIVRMPGASLAMWVEYQPPAFVMRHKTKSGRKSKSWSTFDLDYREPQFVEIIGNIYEHPELLRVNDERDKIQGMG